jgi:hypothetical protein
MKRGYGKQKGSGFERELCVQLSLWITGGTHKDALWRSAMSGGRATVARGAVRQAGDICAVAAEGHSLTDRFYIEAKFYRDLAMPAFFLDGTGTLAKFWNKTVTEAAKYKREPLLIAKQNQYPAMAIMDRDALGLLTRHYVWPRIELWPQQAQCIVICRFDDLLDAPYAKTSRVRV